MIEHAEQMLECTLVTSECASKCQPSEGPDDEDDDEDDEEEEDEIREPRRRPVEPLHTGRSFSLRNRNIGKTCLPGI